MIGKKQPPATVLALAFEATRVHAAQLRRAGDSFEVLKAFSFGLSGSPMTGDPQAIGQEIRQALAQQNIKEQRCIVALPLQWVLSLQTKIPDIAEADIEDFLALEAERNFAYDPEELFISASRCHLPGGEQFAALAGVQREQIENLQMALKVARLKAASFTLGISAIQRAYAESAQPFLILYLGERTVEVAISNGEGLLTMRSLENAVAPEADNGRRFYADVIGRELRVTLGQLPAEAGAGLAKVRVFGSQEQVALLRTDLAGRVAAMGLELEVSLGGRLRISGETQGSMAAAATGAVFLAGKKPDFEFLPPKVSPWKQFTTKTSSRKLAWAAGIAAAFALLILGAFLVQGWQLSQLQGHWSMMAPRVTELEKMQQEIKRFRPWFDNSFRSLSILRKLTEAFPADGVVTAKTLEIHNQSQVICSGVARDNQALFKMLDQLRSTKEVADVKMERISGKNPLQFSFNFRWVEGGSGEH